jgi:hypothetical protein
MKRVLHSYAPAAGGNATPRARHPGTCDLATYSSEEPRRIGAGGQEPPEVPRDLFEDRERYRDVAMWVLRKT